MLATERRYALTRLKAGDYLLPSNDGKTIWRIAIYEDGPSHGLIDMTRDIELWGVWRWTGHTSVNTYVDTYDWDRWELVFDNFHRRKDAIDSAIRGER